MNKDVLRCRMREVARERKHRDPESRALLDALEIWSGWRDAVSVCAFSPLRDEPEILHPWPIGKRLALPLMSGVSLSPRWVESEADLVAGSFGIREPRASAPLAGDRFDLILVPGVAFDRSGGRLGRGRGFYDRFLEGTRGVRVGVCFEDQVVPEVPVEAHDVRMNVLATPKGITICGS